MDRIGARAKRLVRESLALRVLQNASSRWVVDRPLTEVPAWLGKLHDIRVPRSVAAPPRPTPLGAANINILLALLDEARRYEGDVAECGVHRGGTLIPIGLHLKQVGADKTVYGFDSFQGFDAAVDSEIALGGAANSEKRRGGFGDTSVEYVAAKIRRLGLDGRVRLVKGYLDDTLASHADRRYCFVHLDVDIYESYKIGLEYFYPRLAAGGIVLLDEYNDPPWPGCNRAADEFLADKPEKLEAIERDNHVKYFFRKISAAR